MAKVRDCMQIGRTWSESGFMICNYFDTPSRGCEGSGERAIPIDFSHVRLWFGKVVSHNGAALDHKLHVFKLLDVVQWISRDGNHVRKFARLDCPHLIGPAHQIGGVDCGG